MVIPMRNDLDSLRTFLAVCEQGSVTGAANQLGKTQSGVSMQLKRLEDEMGVVLVQRTPRGVVMLDPGRLLRDYARRIIGLCDEARGRLQNTRSSGSVRIGMPEEVATAALWAALGSFRRGRCDTAFQVTLDDTRAIEILWEAAELDIMVVVARAPRTALGVLANGSALGMRCRQHYRPWATSGHSDFCRTLQLATPNARGTRETQRRSAHHIQQR
jgi:DNA-binding transcriptional LysR family regulator